MAKNLFLAGVLVFLTAVAGRSADTRVWGVGGSLVCLDGAVGRGTLELRWDNGEHQWNLSWYTGRAYWACNDFSIATITTYREIDRIRVFSNSDWPNIGWDGFRLGVFAFSGSAPGSLLWGPRFVVGSGTGHVWCDFTIDWVLPAGYSAFVAGVEQFYDYPNNDPWTVDSNRPFMQHSWAYISGRWAPLAGYEGYRNLMLRVVVEEPLAVTPTSVGRVKALYY